MTDKAFKVKVLLFGQKAVGKTSLLATVYDHLQGMPAFEKFVISSPQDHDLDTALGEMKRMVRGLAEGRAYHRTATATERTFTLTLMPQGLEHAIELSIVDMPGETLDAPDQKARWLELIRECDIIIHAISAPALMERDRHFNAEVNKPLRFKTYLQEAVASMDSKAPTKLVFLIPVKCEKYLDAPGALESAVKEAYEPVRTAIRNAGHYCYFLPVQTTGCVVFDRFELDQNQHPVDHYRLKPGTEPVWKPCGNEFLAAHLLDHALWCLEASFPKQAPPVCAPIRAQLQPLCRARILEQPKTSQPRIFNTCFGPASRVLTLHAGPIAIAEVQVGAKVLTQAPDGTFEYQRVTRVGRHQGVAMLALGISGRVLQVTPDHPFWTQQGWRRAGTLQPGDHLVGVDMATGKPSSLAIEFRLDQGLVGPAFNLITEHNGNYVVEGALASSFVFLNGLRGFRLRMAHRFHSSAEPAHVAS